MKKQCTCIEQALNKYSIFNIQIVLKKQGTSREQAGNKQGTSIETVYMILHLTHMMIVVVFVFQIHSGGAFENRLQPVRG